MSVKNVFKRNEAFALCKQALAKAPEGLGAGELTDFCLRANGLNTEDKLLRRSLIQSLAQMLRKHPIEVTTGEKHGATCIWKLASHLG